MYSWDINNATNINFERAVAMLKVFDQTGAIATRPLVKYRILF